MIDNHRNIKFLKIHSCVFWESYIICEGYGTLMKYLIFDLGLMTKEFFSTI